MIIFGMFGVVYGHGDVGDSAAISFILAAVGAALSAHTFARLGFGSLGWHTGAIAGLIAISAHLGHQPWLSFLVGVLTPLFHHIVVLVLDKIGLDDDNGTIAFHGGSGCFGLVMHVILATIFDGANFGDLLLGCFVGCLVITAWSAVVTAVIALIAGLLDNAVGKAGDEGEGDDEEEGDAKSDAGEEAEV